MEYDIPGAIKYGLEQVGDTTIRFQIFWQNEGMTCRKGYDQKYDPVARPGGGRKAGSCSLPAIDSENVWLRGSDRGADDSVERYRFVDDDTGETIEETYEDIVAAIQAWADRADWASVRQAWIDENCYRHEQLELW